jgi:hypothetical protein
MPRLALSLEGRSGRGWLAGLWCCGLLACGPGEAEVSPPSRSIDDPSALPFCERERSDAVRDVFCEEGAPEIRDLRDLRARLDLDFFAPGASVPETGEGYGGSFDMRVVFLGHSTALSGQLVSPINPRAILLGKKAMLAFNRGVQQVELISRDRNAHTLNFYLVTFEQACNVAPNGCSPGDLYTPSIESDWTSVGVEDDDDLKNTPFDCRQCHQRGREMPMLLMRELDGPWTHFFAPDPSNNEDLPEPTGTELVQDYLRAKGSEPYAGIPAEVMRRTTGFALQSALDVGQPLVFRGNKILNERFPWTPTGYAHEPVPSPTWYGAYDAFKRGEYLPLPHFASRPTDPGKQSALTEAYQKYLAGELAAGDLPDFADIFPDDPQVRAEIGLQTEPQATAAQALVQACGTCHNDVLDQSLSRADFTIDLSRMDRVELDVAIGRLRAERGTPSAMPPAGRRQLDDRTRELLIDYLARDVRPAEDDAFLQRAAQLGMAVEQPQEPSGFFE